AFRQLPGVRLFPYTTLFRSKAELDALAVRRAAGVVVDSKDQARLEAGDLQQALEEGWLHWSDVRELGQVIVGQLAHVRPVQPTLDRKSTRLNSSHVAISYAV